VVRTAYLDTGLPLLSQRLEAHWAGRAWMTRWGVGLQDLG